MFKPNYLCMDVKHMEVNQVKKLHINEELHIKITVRQHKEITNQEEISYPFCILMHKAELLDSKVNSKVFWGTSVFSISIY